jgi:hypothetical protein
MVKYCVWVIEVIIDVNRAKVVLMEKLGWLATITNLDAALEGRIPLMSDSDMDSAYSLVIELLACGIKCRYDICS